MDRDDLVAHYASVVGNLDAEAVAAPSYGGHLRKTKGRLLEDMTEAITRIAWEDAGGTAVRLTVNDQRCFKIPVKAEYIDRLPSVVREHVDMDRDEYFYNAQVDKHVFVDDELVLGIECKSYAENAMLKRILVDFSLLRGRFPDLVCCLVQLESQLGGDYATPLADPQLGSKPTHSLMSHFPSVPLHIITLLEGARQVDRPIHKPEFFKELRPKVLDHAIATLAGLLRPFV